MQVLSIFVFKSNIKTNILYVNEHTSDRTSPNINAKHIFYIFPVGMYFLSKKMVIIIFATYSRKFASTDLYTLLTAVKYPDIQLDIAIIGSAIEIRYTTELPTLL